MTNQDTVKNKHELLHRVIDILASTDTKTTIYIVYRNRRSNKIIARYWIHEEMFPTNKAVFSYVKQTRDNERAVGRTTQHNMLQNIHSVFNKTEEVTNVTARIKQKQTHRTPIPYLTTEKMTYTCPSCDNAVYCHPWKKENKIKSPCSCGKTKEWIPVGNTP